MATIPTCTSKAIATCAVELWTHAIGGLSENDFILAAKIDELPIEVKAEMLVRASVVFAMAANHAVSLLHGPQGRRRQVSAGVEAITRDALPPDDVLIASRIRR